MRANEWVNMSGRPPFLCSAVPANPGNAWPTNTPSNSRRESLISFLFHQIDFTQPKYLHILSSLQINYGANLITPVSTVLLDRDSSAGWERVTLADLMTSLDHMIANDLDSIRTKCKTDALWHQKLSMNHYPKQLYFHFILKLEVGVGRLVHIWFLVCLQYSEVLNREWTCLGAPSCT